MLSEIAKNVLNIFIEYNFDREDWVCWGSELDDIDGWEEMYEWMKNQSNLTVELIDEKIEEMLLRL